ncbi:MAG: hypothetical protein LBU48_03360 [Coriobacteriales bacterium]|nr:hypothetical protein [Coriobacteriales bacterium]
MSNLRVEGVQTLEAGGTYELVKIEGVCTVHGDIVGESIDIDGVSTMNGDLGGGRLDCDGVATINGNVQLDDVECDGVTTIGGNLRAKRVVINGVLTVKGSRVEAEKVLCEGVLTVEGELNAEVIEADGYIMAHEIVGERVVIRSRTNRFKRLFIRWFDSKMGKFNFIEATEVELRKVSAKTVHGHTITIGPKCEIDTVDCSGTLHIDPSATVGTITGNYTLV